MKIKMPDVKKFMEESDKEEAEEGAKQKAALEAQLKAPGPVELPAWTPKVPQFTPSGPAARKIIDDHVEIVAAGTSPLTPAQLGDAWDVAETAKFNHARSNNQFNDTKQVIVTLYNTQETPEQKVRLEATRAPEEKITHVTVSSPLPVAEPANDDLIASRGWVETKTL